MDKGEQQIKEHWYAIKVFYNKVFQMEDILSHLQLETYLAVRKVQLKGQEHLSAARKLASVPPGHRPDPRYIQEGPVIYERVPLVSSLMFVKASEEQIQEVDRRLRNELDSTRLLGYIYKTPDWKSFAVIPENQMLSFRLVTQNGAEGLEFFSAEEPVFLKGDKVRVTSGPLKGSEGYIRRIKKDRRLLVVIQGVIAVAASYIPKDQLEKVEG